MTSAVNLLVSVRSAAEAADALAGGADWIDLKEPRRGALGAVEPDVAQDVVEVVGERAPVSAAGGELFDLVDRRPGVNLLVQRLLDVRGISHLKLGLAACANTDWRPRWSAIRDDVVAAGKQLVAVLYADSTAARCPCAEEILDAAIALECSWVLWDTFDKAGPPIDEHFSHETLRRQLSRARGAGLQTVVAGRVDESRLAHLPLELINMIAVRGAVCQGSRDAAVCSRRVAELRETISRHTDCRAAAPR